MQPPQRAHHRVGIGRCREIGPLFAPRFLGRRRDAFDGCPRAVVQGKRTAAASGDSEMSASRFRTCSSIAASASRAASLSIPWARVGEISRATASATTLPRPISNTRSSAVRRTACWPETPSKTITAVTGATLKVGRSATRPANGTSATASATPVDRSISRGEATR